jgi:2-iminobutanoate/2-iminopropanoate deaminase
MRQIRQYKKGWYNVILIFNNINMKEAVSTNKSPLATGPFSQAIKTDNLVFTSGQIYLTTEGILLEGTIEEKTHQVLNNLKNILEEAGSSFDNVVKTTICVTDMSVYGKINEVYGEYFKEPYPAREVVCVNSLPLGAEVEISMIATK